MPQVATIIGRSARSAITVTLAVVAAMISGCGASGARSREQPTPAASTASATTIAAEAAVAIAAFEGAPRLQEANELPVLGFPQDPPRVPGTPPRASIVIVVDSEAPWTTGADFTSPGQLIINQAVVQPTKPNSHYVIFILADGVRPLWVSEDYARRLADWLRESETGAPKTPVATNQREATERDRVMLGPPSARLSFDARDLLQQLDSAFALIAEHRSG